MMRHIILQTSRGEDAKHQQESYQAKNLEVTAAFLKQVERMLLWLQNSLLESSGERWRGGQDTMLHAAQPPHAPNLL